MKPFDFSVMQQMQLELHEKYKGKWESLSPELARQKLLWLYGELGEVSDIIKKKGDQQIVKDPVTRHHFIEELCDVMMYLNDVMLCYQISPQEMEAIYQEKHRINMSRW